MMGENDHVASADVGTIVDVTPPAYPETMDGYEVRVPGTFEFPDTVKFDEGDSLFDSNDPRVASAREFAHANKMTQEQFESMVAIGVKADLAEQASLRAAIAQEVEALGPSARQRVESIKGWLTAKLPAHQASALLGTIYSKNQVEAYEQLMRLNRGAVPGNPGAAREVGKPDISDAEYDAMSATDKIAYARNSGR